MLLEISLLEKPNYFEKERFNKARIQANDVILGLLEDSGYVQSDELKYIVGKINCEDINKAIKKAYADGVETALEAHIINLESEEGIQKAIKVGDEIYELKDSP